MTEEKEDNNTSTNSSMMKRVTWQSENCLSCKWFSPSDPLNADILSTGKCVHPSLQKFKLTVSGRDWCNLFVEISQEQIDQMQEKAAGAEQ
ncbi:hypothetical protein NTE_01155 [Candidatus Nitrososphaera evergladensis SR1]|uniref:Uncharacterized protein n=1 Tax=Candidatus Nitrososphaera evergladensis SR1 TaxID=1459636 RepID=A0A075MPX8_9ARCH|nr:hypothetical protein [Candidatus Nitrososphaera evergladensis]AIF83228.1 hypothetical protein NTE_01155 [Candidatus Nitrososphaera evergladensis SR1]